jgi:sn-glycerol 3-phosphate transport system permease protein
MPDRRGTAARYALLTICAVVVLFPIYTALVLSIQPAGRVVDFPRVLLPSSIRFTSYRQAWSDGNLGRLLLNSLVVTTVIVAAQVVTSVLAAYAFVFLRFPAKRVVFVVFLSTLMLPVEVTLVANYETVRRFGWLDSYPALTVPFLATAFGTFLVRQAFLQVPRDLREAAELDGAGHLRFLRTVAVPVARPSIAALGVYSFLLAWNQYLWPLLVTDDDRRRTVQVGLRSLAVGNIDRLDVVLAGTILAGLPIFVLLVVFQRQLVRGVTSGAVKG